MAALPTAQETWASVTNVERTALQVSLFRVEGGAAAAGQPALYDTSFDEAIVAACVPPEERGKHHWRPDASKFMAIRTAELDEQLLRLVGESQAVQQVVILGAGLDSRAWRLHWPEPRPTVFEVDTGSLEAVKARVLGRFPLRCGRRAFVAADLGDKDALRQGLLAAGFSTEARTVWLMEGLIGYLTEAQGYRLFRAMHGLSPPGSGMVMTCPPSAADRKESLQYGVRLYHATYEDPPRTYARLRRAGWAGRIITSAELATKYGGACKKPQPQIVAHWQKRASLPAWAAATSVGAGAALVLALVLAGAARRP